MCLFPLVILLPFFLFFSNVAYLILYMYVCSKNSNKVDKTNTNRCFGIAVLSGVTAVKATLDDLFKLQKQCARLISGGPHTARSIENFQKLKWLPVDQLFLIDKICLFCEIIEGHGPDYLISKLKSFCLQHKYNTKCKTDSRLPKSRTNSLKITYF